MSNDRYIAVIGTFDLFHKGHVELLRRASQFGKVLAGVNTDRFVEQFKGKRPTINENDRLEVIKSCKYVDKVILNDNADLKETLKDLNVSALVFGNDYDIEQYRKQTQITEEYQIENDLALIQFPRTKDISTTSIYNNIS